MAGNDGRSVGSNEATNTNTGGAPSPQGRPVDGIDPETLARAQAMIASMRDDYLTWAQEDLTALFAALDALDGNTGDPAATKAEVFRVAHDMKGQGGSFGFALITIVGNGLCRFLEKTGDPLTANQRATVRAHAESLRHILAERIEGDGGEAEAAMLDRLDQMRTAALT